MESVSAFQTLNFWINRFGQSWRWLSSTFFFLEIVGDIKIYNFTPVPNHKKLSSRFPRCFFNFRPTLICDVSRLIKKITLNLTVQELIWLSQRIFEKIAFKVHKINMGSYGAGRKNGSILLFTKQKSQLKRQKTNSL